MIKLKTAMKNEKFKIKGIKKGDKAMVMSGDDRKKVGKILKVLFKENKAVVEGLNLVKRHLRPKRQGEKGQIVAKALPIRLSNLLLMCPSCGKPTRRAFKILKGGKKVRMCKKCKSEI